MMPPQKLIHPIAEPRERTGGSRIETLPFDIIHSFLQLLEAVTATRLLMVIRSVAF